MKNLKGTLFVLDGGDGSGKHTQTELFFAKMTKLGFPIEMTDFPRYEDNFFGKLIGQFQSDPKLQFAKINPYLASIPYAGDRFESKQQLYKWLHDGKNIISDRYVSANQLHQGGKIKDTIERKEFLKNLDYMEYEIFKIPRPDLIIYLDVPHDISVELMKKKAYDAKKAYNDGSMDEVEKDIEYQLGARESALKMLEDPSWVRVQCSLDGVTMRTPEDIHDEIWQHCLPLLQ